MSKSESSPNLAKRLECVVFSDAFRATGGVPFALASPAKAVLKPPQSKRFAPSTALRFTGSCRKFAMNLFLAIALPAVAMAQDQVPLAGTQPLTLSGDLSAKMVAGIDKFLAREIERSVVERQTFWKRNFTSPEAYEQSVAPNRDRLRKIIGAVDARLPIPALEFVSSTASPAKVGETELFTVYAVRWPVFDGVFGEGLWLQPKTTTKARVVAIPDADQTPEMLVGLAPRLAPERQFARRLAEHGCEVLVPLLVDRQDTWSGSPRINRFTNQPHREWLYRQAFELGRHIIGYEVQKVMAAVDWLEQKRVQSPESGVQSLKIGVVGYSEGGLIAFYAAALDTRIEAALVSGYFDSRQRVPAEPLYRNVFGLLREFGDAEIASLIAPRALIVEYSEVPKVDGPPKPREGRSGGAPGRLKTPAYESVEAEFERARALLKGDGLTNFARCELITGTEGATTGPGSDRALAAFLKALGQPIERVKRPGQSPEDLRKNFDPQERQRHQVAELVAHTQRIFRESERARGEFFAKNIKPDSVENLAASTRQFRDYFRDQIIGVFTNAALPANPRSRRILDRPKWTGYEVVLDVFPDVYAWGYLLLPKDLRPGERRPVVVCQHGLEGLPADLVNADPQSGAYHIYKAFAARLADQGFVVFAPHNPYRGDDSFRQLVRKANPLGKTLYSIIVAQHSRILDWLVEQPFVDSARIGFYGMSYGGKTAMRVPVLLDRYALSICSGDFNEWIQKVVSLDFPASFMFVPEYEVLEFNLGNTFGYAEMATLIAPRPFMVERGRYDPMGTDEYVSYEFAKVRRLYDQLGIGTNTQIEFFNGRHTVNGVSTFDFLHKHLNWPRSEK